MWWTALALVPALALSWHPSVEAASVLEQMEQEQQALFERVAPSVVFIASKEGFGSGFFVDSEGLVLTSAHVVADRKSVEVVLHDGRKLPGQVIELGRNGFDLALVKVSLQPTIPLVIAVDVAPRVGTWIATIGHGLGGAWAFTTGMVTNVYPLGQERPVFQTQIPINPGSSGGPVIDRHWRVIGVVTAAVRNASDMNFAVRVDKACDVLIGAAKLCRRLVLRAPEGVPVFLDGKAVGRGPKVSVPATPGWHEVFVVVNGEMRKQHFTYPQQSVVDLTR